MPNAAVTNPATGTLPGFDVRSLATHKVDPPTTAAPPMAAKRIGPLNRAPAHDINVNDVTTNNTRAVHRCH